MADLRNRSPSRTCTSPSRYVSQFASQYPLTSSHTATTDVLSRPNLLQTHHKPHQTLHPLPLPAHLLPTLVPPHVLVLRHCRLRLRLGLHRRHHLSMHPHPAPLGQSYLP